LQNSPLESICVVIALIENYSTSKPLKVSPEKSLILSCDTVVANERYVEFLLYKLMLKLHMSKNLKTPWRWPTAKAETCHSIN